MKLHFIFFFFFIILTLSTGINGDPNLVEDVKKKFAQILAKLQATADDIIKILLN